MLNEGKYNLNEETSSNRFLLHYLLDKMTCFFPNSVIVSGKQASDAMPKWTKWSRRMHSTHTTPPAAPISPMPQSHLRREASRRSLTLASLPSLSKGQRGQWMGECNVQCAVCSIGPFPNWTKATRCKLKANRRMDATFSKGWLQFQARVFGRFPWRQDHWTKGEATPQFRICTPQAASSLYPSLNKDEGKNVVQISHLRSTFKGGGGEGCMRREKEKKGRQIEWSSKKPSARPSVRPSVWIPSCLPAVPIPVCVEEGPLRPNPWNMSRYCDSGSIAIVLSVVSQRRAESESAITAQRSFTCACRIVERAYFIRA